MFRVQAPGGAWSEYVHTLSPGEAMNNSWVAISPDGQWMLSGEWGTMDRLLVFPTPGENPSTSPSANLPQAATVRLDHAVRDVQAVTSPVRRPCCAPPTTPTGACSA